MDRPIEKKKWTVQKIVTIAVTVAIVILIAASYYSTSGKSRLNVDLERIRVSEVSNGTFQVKSADLKVESASKNIKAIRGQMLPGANHKDSIKAGHRSGFCKHEF